MRKRKAVDSYFHAIRNTVGKDRSVIMPYGNGSFPRPPKDEDSLPRGSMKRHLLTRSAGEHRTGRGGPCCRREEYRRAIHRCIGVAAPPAVWEEKLDMAEAPR